VGRLGCLAAGCCYGKPFSLGIVYTDPLALAPLNIPLHPAQLYEAALDALLAWRLHAGLKRRGEPAGKVACGYLLGYAAIRFFVQFFRNDDAGHLVLGLAHSQYMAAALALAGLWLLRRIQRNSRTSAPAATR
jgi:phosphatidylglycerol---prolipoprotein diacylglyceryl transferase